MIPDNVTEDSLIFPEPKAPLWTIRVTSKGFFSNTNSDPSLNDPSPIETRVNRGQSTLKHIVLNYTLNVQILLFILPLTNCNRKESLVFKSLGFRTRS